MVSAVMIGSARADFVQDQHVGMACVNRRLAVCI